MNAMLLLVGFLLLLLESDPVNAFSVPSSSSSLWGRTFAIDRCCCWSPMLTRSTFVRQQQQQQQQQHHQRQHQQHFHHELTLYMTNMKPFAVIVQTEINPDRMEEFLTMIRINAEQTRQEPGCIRFDVVRVQDIPNQFLFYELYQNETAIDHHKQQPHYQAWVNFKTSGGTVSSVSYKTDGEFITP